MGLFRTKNSSPEVQKAINNAIYPSVFGETSSAVENAINNYANSGGASDGAYSSAYNTNTIRSGVIKSYTDGDITYMGDIVDSMTFNVPANYNYTPKTTDAGGDMMDWWENSERDGNIRPPDLPLKKPICRSRSNS